MSCGHATVRSRSSLRCQGRCGGWPNGPRRRRCSKTRWCTSTSRTRHGAHGSPRTAKRLSAGPAGRLCRGGRRSRLGDPAATRGRSGNHRARLLGAVPPERAAPGRARRHGDCGRRRLRNGPRALDSRRVAFHRSRRRITLPRHPRQGSGVDDRGEWCAARRRHPAPHRRVVRRSRVGRLPAVVARVTFAICSWAPRPWPHPCSCMRAPSAMAGSGFTITTSDGWFLYGRIAAIANCDGAPIPTRRARCASRQVSSGSTRTARCGSRALRPDGCSPTAYHHRATPTTRVAWTPTRTGCCAGSRSGSSSGTRVVSAAWSPPTSVSYFHGVRGVGPELVIYGESNPVLAIPRQLRLIRPIAGLALALAIAATALGAARRSIRGAWPESARSRC